MYEFMRYIGAFYGLAVPKSLENTEGTPGEEEIYFGQAIAVAETLLKKPFHSINEVAQNIDVCIRKENFWFNVDDESTLGKNLFLIRAVPIGLLFSYNLKLLKEATISITQAEDAITKAASVTMAYMIAHAFYNYEGVEKVKKANKTIINQNT